MTNGIVNVVDPLKITQEFSSILSQPIIATHVNVKLVMHNGLFIRKDGVDSEQTEKHSFVTKEVGNVTSESSFTFEYGVKDAKEVKEKGLSALPFQLQINYTKLNGAKCIRVITREQKVTWDRQKAETDVNLNVLGQYAMQQTANIAFGGHYNDARLNNYAQLNMLQRVAKTSSQQEAYGAWAAKGVGFEGTMVQQQQQEINEGLDLENDDFGEKGAVLQPQPSEVADMRKQRRGDGVSNMLWNMKSKRQQPQQPQQQPLQPQRPPQPQPPTSGWK